MAREVTLESGKKISEKTVQSWLNLLGSPNTFNGQKLYRSFVYHPNFLKENLDLEYFCVFVDDAKMKLMDEFSQIYHIVWVYNAKNGKKSLTMRLLIPRVAVPAFKKKWAQMKKKGIVGDYQILNLNTQFIIYSPWHKVVGPQGMFYPERNDDAAIDRQIGVFSKYCDTLPVKSKMHKSVRNNPFMLPVIFEYDSEHASSVDVWNSMKSRMGDVIWDYIKNSNRRTDSIGIKRVQQTIRDAHSNSLFQQIRIDYDPLEFSNFWVYTYLKFSGKNHMVETVRKISKKSLVSHVYPEKNTYNVFVTTLMNHKSLQGFFDIISDDKINAERTFFVLHSNSYELLHSKLNTHMSYWSHFDPQTSSWKQ